MRRDPAFIPEKILKVAERAQAALETLPPADRMAFIEKKAHVWRGFKKYLSKMSYGKCWYSESPDPQSFFDVDHFRPKSEAKRSETITDEGYPWLAFNWDNFRYSAGRSNRLSTDEETDETAGKSSWFPLIDGSVVASWDDRRVADERPLLIDPTDQDDARLIKVDTNGRIAPSRFCVGTNKKRVTASTKLYGLDLPNLTEARLRVMRDVSRRVDDLLKCVAAADAYEPVADALPIPEQQAAITNLTLPSSAYSLAARSKLHELGLAELIAKPEDYPVVAA
ncbi:hypothetical protein [Rhizobium phaseoli]|uniref:hypothetical protein n=1 Tax=Rhizobium phaseoli TaxID=396 RepID=UPI001FCDB4C3|nr:hypothetical protein [Rhizobium phaseoli]